MTTRPHVYRKGLIFLTEKMYQALILASRCYKRKDGSFTYGHMRAAAAKDEHCPSLHIVNQLIHYGVIRKIRGFSTTGRISDEVMLLNNDVVDELTVLMALANRRGFSNNDCRYVLMAERCKAEGRSLTVKQDKDIIGDYRFYKERFFSNQQMIIITNSKEDQRKYEFNISRQGWCLHGIAKEINDILAKGQAGYKERIAKTHSYSNEYTRELRRLSLNL